MSDVRLTEGGFLLTGPIGLHGGDAMRLTNDRRTTSVWYRLINSADDPYAAPAGGQLVRREAPAPLDAGAPDTNVLPDLPSAFAGAPAEVVLTGLIALEVAGLRRTAPDKPPATLSLRLAWADANRPPLTRTFALPPALRFAPPAPQQPAGNTGDLRPDASNADAENSGNSGPPQQDNRPTRRGYDPRGRNQAPPPAGFPEFGPPPGPPA